MASKSSLNIHSTYHESFLALSVGIRVNKHQLKMENQRNQAPVLRYRDITVTSEALKGCLAAECPVLGVHNVARMRTGTLPLFEVDFIEKKAFERFCRSLQGEVTILMCCRFIVVTACMYIVLQKRLGKRLKLLSRGQNVDVMVKLHLIMPNASKKDALIREVTTANHQECFSLLKESGLFEFRDLDLAHPVPPHEDSTKDELSKEMGLFIIRFMLSVLFIQPLRIFGICSRNWLRCQCTGSLWGCSSRCPTTL